MKILERPSFISKLDPSGVLASARLFPDQVNAAWNEVKNLKLPEKYSRVLNVVVGGMGGSALGARIIDSLAFENLTLPLEIVSDYHLPAYVNRHTLVLLSSYSGNTEETLSCFREAHGKKALLVVITTGGRLAELARQAGVPTYLISPNLNPSAFPRMGLGYSLAGELALFAKLGFIHLEDTQITEAVNHLKSRVIEFSEYLPATKNPAKKLARTLSRQAVGLVSAEHLTGAAHSFQNMLNENSKTFAVNFILPELNHHLLEGLTNPAGLSRQWLFLLIQSPTYAKVIKDRFEITKRVLEKQGFEVFRWEAKGRTKLIQALDLVLAGEFASAYLAFCRRINPGPIPWIDYFKKEIKKEKDN